MERKFERKWEETAVTEDAAFAVARWAAFCLLLWLSAEDIKHREVSIRLLSALLAGSTAVLPFRMAREGAGVLIGVLPGVILFLAAYALPTQLGKGDGAVCTALGLLLSWERLWLSLSAALLCAAFVSALLFLCKKAGRKTKLPFIPFLCAGYLLALRY